MRILYLPRFARQYKKLPREVRELAEKRERIFREDPFDPRLKTHKLSGDLEGYYAFSINFSYRIIFEFGNPETVWFHQVGTHDIYDE